MGNSITTPTMTTTLPSLPMIRALERIAAMEPDEIDLDLSYLGLTELPPLPERLSIHCPMCYRRGFGNFIVKGTN